MFYISGNTVYHLTVTLNAIVNPLMAFIAFFLPCPKKNLVVFLTIFGTFITGFIVATAFFSPYMIVSNKEVGGTLVVLAWVLSGAIFSYAKVSLAGMCREAGWLFSYGVFTQIGSALGSLLMFLLVNQVMITMLRKYLVGNQLDKAKFF